MNFLENELAPLWKQAHQGDEQAYAQSLGLIARALRPYFRSRLSNMSDEVEDLVQETLIAVHNKRGTYDPAYPVSAWVYAIAKYKLIDLLRRRRADRLTDSIDDVDESLLKAVETDHNARNDLDKLLIQIPHAQRVAIELTKVQGLSIEEASQQTGHSASSIKVQVHRGLKALSQLIRKGQS